MVTTTKFPLGRHHRKRGTNQEEQDDQTGHDGTRSSPNLIRRVRYASQRPTILPKIGSANGDANGSQLGRSTGSRKTVLKLDRRSPLRARSTEGNWLCHVA